MDTGTTRFKHLWSAALCLILLSAAIPLAVLALSMSARKTETLVSPELETEELTVPDKTAEPVEQEKRIKRRGLTLDPPPISPDFVNPPDHYLHNPSRFLLKFQDMHSILLFHFEKQSYL